ncbi:MAG: PhoH family protein [Gammaproteobacteria bacterium]|nr:PhoH family protein [Gammaproteobacteria bacterium]
MQADQDERKLFVLHSSVLIHDPSAIFRFQEHDVFLAFSVLDRLANGNHLSTEMMQNARQFNQFLDELVRASSSQGLQQGIPLLDYSLAAKIDSNCRGKLHFQTEFLSSQLPKTLPKNSQDNEILETILALKTQNQSAQVVLVSRDISLRIKAGILGITAQDYFNASALEDIDLLYSGSLHLTAEFWDSDCQFRTWTEKSRTFYRIESEQVRDWYPNQYIVSTASPEFEAYVMSVEGKTALLAKLENYRTESTWGITALNADQNFALNMLLNPDVDFVTLLGNAGTGKTLLALAAGLQMTMEENRFQEIIMTRETVSVGEDIGYLPGTEEEKMAPWMGALMDNLELLGGGNQTDSWKKSSTQDVLMSRIKLRSINYMRGRTFQNRYIILDEAQNLTVKQIKTLITRAGPKTKLICLGNLAQIDTKYLSATSSGLTFAVDRFKRWKHSAHITLMRGERSRLADYASLNL